ncbi:MAG TPA: DNA alkylation repair protein [Chitinivibrionales bacterium]|jgi:3-methyladenine DNA glycosylase AlkD|nr:DNA alkylation repair protein [Chitinivibrionales bacterium]
MPSPIVTSIRKSLKASSSEKTRKTSETFFKEKAKFHGAPSAAYRKIGREHFAQVKKLDKREILFLCEELLQSGYVEEAIIAYEWADRLRSSFTESDFAVFERWLGRYVSNWAECDTLCNHAVGSFVEQYPAFVDRLKAWAKSGSRWFRRAAAVTLVLPARRGKFLEDIFEIAGILLTDGDDLVQKGYGWMLKEASKLHPKEVFDFIMERRTAMPRTALRYAIEKMPRSMRKKAMER